MTKANPMRDDVNDLKDVDQANGETQASVAYRLLRQDIITSSLPAGSKLRIRDLCKKYDLAMSSIREALNRLTKDGLVQLIDLRGFSVSPVTREDLDDLTKARGWLNEIALRASIAHGGQQWEEGIVVAFHRMSRTPRHRDPNDPAVNPDWEFAHRAFHTSLISACGSAWVLGYCGQLFDAADRYRHLARAVTVERKDDHKEIMEATIARDADEAARLLNAHFERTAEYGRLALSGSAREPKKQRKRRAQLVAGYEEL
jgi:GntR family transcriptional regulator, carbon starvation induced regulator